MPQCKLGRRGEEQLDLPGRAPPQMGDSDSDSDSELCNEQEQEHEQEQEQEECVKLFYQKGSVKGRLIFSPTHFM